MSPGVKYGLSNFPKIDLYSEKRIEGLPCISKSMVAIEAKLIRIVIVNFEVLIRKTNIIIRYRKASDAVTIVYFIPRYFVYTITV